MFLVLEDRLDEKASADILDALVQLGMQAELVRSSKQVLIFVHSDVRAVPTHKFTRIPGVARVMRTAPTSPLALSDELRTVDLTSNQNSLTIGGGAAPVIMAGPCSVEGREQLLELAHKVKSAGATMLRGGAFKPRTSPYEFPGLGQDALSYLREASIATGLPVVSEVMSAEQIEIALDYVDMLQIGARNMYNYELLKEVGKAGKPVFLKRGLSATIDEFVHAVEYIMLAGNNQVVLCERGIRTFETRTRNTLDLSAVPLLKSMTGLPVIVDPSHATGKRSLIRSMSRAAIACGADGLMIETHCQPNQSISDAEQAITPDDLALISADSLALFESLKGLDETPAGAAGPQGEPRPRLVVACATPGSN
ncbi:3-deoxy-7-phosphoheptulonate synthase [Candidatus Obscuribacterales bacterium]|nr:3-deoxy-7-phosphoheptulonate synthase [Candidatus Obscuribacterales bacterium]MBX3138117.1 3-deoxy-7-phosphoheptulonate synthase [Candidatus Obscuribacterales bacterium]